LLSSHFKLKFNCQLDCVTVALPKISHLRVQWSSPNTQHNAV